MHTVTPCKARVGRDAEGGMVRDCFFNLSDNNQMLCKHVFVYVWLCLWVCPDQMTQNSIAFLQHVKKVRSSSQAYNITKNENSVAPKAPRTGPRTSPRTGPRTGPRIIQDKQQ